MLRIQETGRWRSGAFAIKKTTLLDMVCIFHLLLMRLGYELIIKDMTLKRKYTHEWRESWEKIDTIRDLMHQFPHHEWFWWLDLVKNCFLLRCLTLLAYIHHGAVSFSGHAHLLSS